MNDKLVSIKDGKPISAPTKKTRRKTGQDAKRWVHLIEQLRTGNIVLSISGLDLVDAGYLDATIEQFDIDISKMEHLLRSETEKSRRKKKHKT